MDLGLSYEEAIHGVQSAIRYEMTQHGFTDGEQDKVAQMLKHLRTGIDMRASDAGGLATLLIAKGVITLAEYTEHLRIAANKELARYTAHCRSTYGLPDNVDFR